MIQTGYADLMGPLRRFVGDFTGLLATARSEEDLLGRGAELLGLLVSEDGWLPREFACPDPTRYQQYLLHCDGQERFSVVSFVWSPGQQTPVHNHTVWGLVGILRGTEVSQPYRQDGAALVEDGAPRRLKAGDVERLSARFGDIHRVWNGSTTETAVSIHVYGANIGAVRRSVYAPDGSVKPFISGYANAFLPNFWGGERD